MQRQVWSRLVREQVSKHRRDMGGITHAATLHTLLTVSPVVACGIIAWCQKDTEYPGPNKASGTHGAMQARNGSGSAPPNDSREQLSTSKLSPQNKITDTDTMHHGSGTLFSRKEQCLLQHQNTNEQSSAPYTANERTDNISRQAGNGNFNGSSEETDYYGTATGSNAEFVNSNSHSHNLPSSINYANAYPGNIFASLQGNLRQQPNHPWAGHEALLRHNHVPHQFNAAHLQQTTQDLPNAGTSGSGHHSSQSTTGQQQQQHRSMLLQEKRRSVDDLLFKNSGIGPSKSSMALPQNVLPGRSSTLPEVRSLLGSESAVNPHASSYQQTTSSNPCPQLAKENKTVTPELKLPQQTHSLLILPELLCC